MRFCPTVWTGQIANSERNAGSECCKECIFSVAMLHAPFLSISSISWSGKLLHEFAPFATHCGMTSQEWNSTKAENEEFWKAPRFALCSLAAVNHETKKNYAKSTERRRDIDMAVCNLSYENCEKLWFEKKVQMRNSSFLLRLFCRNEPNSSWCLVSDSSEHCEKFLFFVWRYRDFGLYGAMPQTRM